MRGLVLSLFSGLGMLDEGFREEGFCVVSAGDICWGPLWDIRKFHPPPGVFDGVIGGPPCPAHSRLRSQIKASGKEPSEDLTSEFARCIEEASPRWWVMENAPACDSPVHGARKTILDNRWLGEKQRRRRVFYSNLHLIISGETFENLEWEHAVTSDARPVPIVIGGSGKRKRNADLPPRSIGDVLELQGFPRDMLDGVPWTMQAKRQMVGNGVPLPMARAVAKAVVKALDTEEACPK